MKRHIFIYLLALATTVSCNWLDKESDTELTLDMVFQNKTRVEGWLGNVYSGKANKEEEKTDEPVHLKIDGVDTEFQPGVKYEVPLGCSVCFEPYTYHTFWMEGGNGLIGEVSMVNDDAADNRFYEPTGRFPDIEEDVPATCLLCTEYPELDK